MFETMKRSVNALYLLVFFIAIGITLFSSGIYFVERGDYDEMRGYYVREGEESETPFNSIPASMWWCIVTIITVGYGDVIPITMLGKLIASVTSIVGILIVALPIAIIGSRFSGTYREMIEEQRRSKDREDLKEKIDAFRADKIALGGPDNVSEEEFIYIMTQIRIDEVQNKLCDMVEMLQESREYEEEVISKFEELIQHARKKDAQQARMSEKFVKEKVRRPASIEVNEVEDH